MHPILTNPRSLGLYLFLFAQAGLLLAELMIRTTPAPRLEAWALVVPLALVHAWSCLASWYLCRSMSLETTRPSQLIMVHLATALAAAGVLLAIGTGWARMLATQEGLRQGAALWDGHRILVFAYALLLFSLAVAVHYVLLALAASQAAEKRAYELRLLAREAELKMLRAQIDPHFLFNSLNSISSLVVADPQRAREMTIGLADFLRRSLRVGEREEITLAEEIALVESYLAVERIRFGDRLSFERRLADGVAERKVPPLLLQPLIENAIRHGIAHLLEPGTVRLTTEIDNGVLRLRVENDYDEETPVAAGRGLGLSNVRQRLAARYGSRAALKVKKEGGLFQVEITLPEQTE